MTTKFKPKAYLKNSCPFSFKVVMFMAEAGLMEQLEITCIDNENEEEINHYRDFLQQATGKPASFPTVEIAPGQYCSESDEVIDYFANQYGVDVNDLPGLAYYKANLFPAYIKNFKALKAFREKCS